MENKFEISPLIWHDNPEKKGTDIFKVASRAGVNMPPIVGKACIEITEHITHGQSVCYEVTLWAFNCGTGMVGYCEAWTIAEAKEKANKWWVNFISGLLYN